MIKGVINRVENRTIHDKNEIVLYDNYAEVILYDRKSQEIGKAKIDLEDVEKVSKHKWGFDGEYVRGTINGKFIRLHRFLVDVNEDMVVDHIDRDKTNNTRANLRVCTRKNNARNQGVSTNNKSGYTGVSYANKQQRWVAYIWLNGKQKKLGTFKSKEEAIEVRRNAEKKYFKEYQAKRREEENYG